MKSTYNAQPFDFTIEGRFLGFGYEGAKLKYLKLGLATEHFQIKLPKHLRMGLPPTLPLDAPIQVSGVGQLDPVKDVLKLKAREVNAIAAVPPTTAPAACPMSAPTPRRKESCAKILLCHKSGCQKRGGRQLSQALEETLRDRPLHRQVEIQYTGCQKRCSSAPNLTFMPGNHHYRKVDPSKLSSLIDKHLSPR